MIWIIILVVIGVFLAFFSGWLYSYAEKNRHGLAELILPTLVIMSFLCFFSAVMQANMQGFKKGAAVFEKEPRVQLTSFEVDKWLDLSDTEKISEDEYYYMVLEGEFDVYTLSVSKGEESVDLKRSNPKVQEAGSCQRAIVRYAGPFEINRTKNYIK